MSNNQSSVRILVACHKPGYAPADDVYLPIHVGRAVSACTAQMQGMIGDDTGPNISDQNPSFCELTALYWAWKNLTPPAYVGLCHYRRYFDFHHRAPLWADCRHVPADSAPSLDLSLPPLAKLFAHADIVLPKPILFHYTLAEQYARCHPVEQLGVLFGVMRRRHPDYMPALRHVFLEKNQLPPYNMMLMRWADFEAYCAWLFDVLFAAQRELDVSALDAYQRRIWGFWGERLLSVFVAHRGLRPAHRPVLYLTDERQKSLASRAARCCRNHVGFALGGRALPQGFDPDAAE